MISIVIVTYNSARVLADCLRSLGNAETIVVDNASSDDSVRIAKNADVRVIPNRENRGFASACHQGVAASTGELVLILNPDTVLLEGLDALAETLSSDPQAGAASGVLVDAETRQPQAGFSVRRLPTFGSLAFEVLGVNRVWPGNPVNRRYRALDVDLAQRQRVEQPAGACLLIKRQVWDQLNGFDESFRPLWFEDVDFCFRLRQAGFAIWLEPRCRFLHSGGHSLEKMGLKERQLYWYGNLVYYVKKNIGSAAALGMRVFIGVGACARIVGALTSGQKGQTGAFRAVLKLAWKGPSA